MTAVQDQRDVTTAPLRSRIDRDGAGEAVRLPFGSAHVITTPTYDLRFPGQWFQAESGLHQNWMRDYDPTTGRYMQADPLGQMYGPEAYSYAALNPQ